MNKKSLIFIGIIVLIAGIILLLNNNSNEDSLSCKSNIGGIVSTVKVTFSEGKSSKYVYTITNGSEFPGDPCYGELEDMTCKVENNVMIREATKITDGNDFLGVKDKTKEETKIYLEQINYTCE